MCFRHFVMSFMTYHNHYLMQNFFDILKIGTIPANNNDINIDNIEIFNLVGNDLIEVIKKYHKN